MFDCLHQFVGNVVSLLFDAGQVAKPNQTKPIQTKPKLAENPKVVGGLFLQAISFTLHSTCPFDPPLNVNDTELVSVFRAFFTSITSGALALS